MNDKWQRFEYGIPARYADWGWMQHFIATLNELGCATILMSTGALTRGLHTKNGSEQSIRRAFIQRDFIEAVILLPDNLFQGTTVPCALLLLRRKKSAERQGKVLLVDASQSFTENYSKKILTQESIAAIMQVNTGWETRKGFSRVVTQQEIKSKNYNLNPPIYIDKGIEGVLTPHLLKTIQIEIGVIRVQHQQLYTELAQRLDT